MESRRKNCGAAGGRNSCYEHSDEASAGSCLVATARRGAGQGGQRIRGPRARVVFSSSAGRFAFALGRHSTANPPAEEEDTQFALAVLVLASSPPPHQQASSDPSASSTSLHLHVSASSLCDALLGLALWNSNLCNCSCPRPPTRGYAHSLTLETRMAVRSRMR
mmetsp:Transcript_25245/g.63530  ORF Transcript_25245/g.63530 Transcript_25245/m.63530 type:complete len:164 (-) Transcript_25245:570-1061(-)